MLGAIDVALRIDAEIMADALALHDLADPFLLPRYFLLVVELDQFDPALEYELEQFNL